MCRINRYAYSGTYYYGQHGTSPKKCQKKSKKVKNPDLIAIYKAASKTEKVAMARTFTRHLFRSHGIYAYSGTSNVPRIRRHLRSPWLVP